MSELVTLIFESADGPYNAGEIAGVGPLVAERLLKSKKARKAQPDDIAAYEARKRGMTAPALTPVRFIQREPPYHNGEVAGFVPKLAQAYVDAGVAEAVEPPAPPALKAVDAPPKDKAMLSPEAKKALR